MSQNKVSTREANRKRIADAISEILSNPETPTDMFNDVADRLCEWSSAYCMEAEKKPAHILACMKAYERQEKTDALKNASTPDYYADDDISDAPDDTPADIPAVMPPSVDQPQDLNLWRQVNPRPIKTTAVTVQGGD